jgi:hypothetical protein
MKRVASVVLTLVLVATAGAAVKHKSELAATEATAVLDLVYVKHDFAKAHARLHPELRATLSQDDLAKLSSVAEFRLGPTKKFDLDSFAAAPEEKQLTVFINGVNEKGTAYHRVTLIGDATGYKVGRLAVQGAPYPADKARQAFKKP